MNRKFGAIAGILGYIGHLFLCGGVATILLYHKGDALSLFIVFSTVLATPFFISGIKYKELSDDIFFNDILLGVGGSLFLGFILLIGPRETVAVCASLSMYVIITLKMRPNK